MKKVLLTLITIIAYFSIPVFACEEDRNVDGNRWTYHRMDDGNSYHELILKDDFEEGTDLVLTLPCKNRYIDAVQIQRGKQNKKIKVDLVIYPGEENIGAPLRVEERQSTWAVQRNANKIEFQISGPRDKDARLRWVRVFYGKNEPESNKMKKKH
jgi:hypothetical protein